MNLSGFGIFCCERPFYYQIFLNICISFHFPVLKSLWPCVHCVFWNEAYCDVAWVQTSEISLQRYGRGVLWNRKSFPVIGKSNKLLYLVGVHMALLALVMGLRRVDFRDLKSSSVRSWPTYVTSNCHLFLSCL